jgi:hypothetical protein
VVTRHRGRGEDDSERPYNNSVMCVCVRTWAERSLAAAA